MTTPRELTPAEAEAVELARRQLADARREMAERERPRIARDLDGGHTRTEVRISSGTWKEP